MPTSARYECNMSAVRCGHRTLHCLYIFYTYRMPTSAHVVCCQGTPSLAKRSLLKNSPPDCFSIHPLRSASKALCGVSPHPLPEALPLDSAKGLSTLWNPTIICLYNLSATSDKTCRVRLTLNYTGIIDKPIA
jgi:hypothetical protein